MQRYLESSDPGSTPRSATTIRRIRAHRVAAAAVALSIPLVLIGNAVHAIAHPWFVSWEYARLGQEPVGMTKGERTRLAKVALDAIVPFGGSDHALGEARLSNGSPAFDDKERRHLRSVRDYVVGLYAVNAAGLLALAGLAIARRTRPIVRDGLAAGALFTLAVSAFVGIYVAIAPVSFLGGFHRVFFSGDSWRFAETETLRRLFPDAFWSDTAILLGAGVAVQAAALLAAALWQRRQATRARARTAPHEGS